MLNGVRVAELSDAAETEVSRPEGDDDAGMDRPSITARMSANAGKLLERMVFGSTSDGQIF